MQNHWAYLELIKFRYHITFLTVVFAASIFSTNLDRQLLLSLFELYLSFNVLFYGGIYTFNDLRDLESDRQHPRKRRRPLPSGRISTRHARFFAGTLITAGLITALMLFGSSMFAVYVAVLALNLFYSLVARNVPYLDIVINTATHPLRFLLGVLLVNRPIPFLHLVAYFFFVFGLSCLRRELEKDIPGWEARPTLKAYSTAILRKFELMSMFMLVVFFFLDGFASKGFYSVVITTYLFLVCGAYGVPMLRKVLHGIWTR